MNKVRVKTKASALELDLMWRGGGRKRRGDRRQTSGRRGRRGQCKQTAACRSCWGTYIRRLRVHNCTLLVVCGYYRQLRHDSSSQSQKKDPRILEIGILR